MAVWQKNEKGEKVLMPATRTTKNIFAVHTSRSVVFPEGFRWLNGIILGLAANLRNFLQRWFNSNTPAVIKAHKKIIQNKKQPNKKKKRIEKELQQQPFEVLNVAGMLNDSDVETSDVDTDIEWAKALELT